MERKIGEIFEYNGEWYQCLKSNSCRCDYCDYGELGDCQKIACTSGERSDNKEVHFKKLDKIGEPYALEDGRKFQKYVVFHTTYVYSKIGYSWQSFADPYYVSLEIKQNKEDMEEKNESAEEISIHIANEFKEKLEKHFKEKMEENYKAEDTPLTRLVGRYVNNLIDYDVFEKAVKELYADKEESKPNLKPFDLEAAKAGKPVCTRDGRKARIICFDKKKDIYPLIALVTDKDGYEIITSYKADGVHPTIPNDDLMMLPEKKEGWIVIHKEAVYDKETAEKIARETTADVIRIQKIECEE